jgi:2-(1,2-epoxy-1,2-dihydrophenyl)acetyl-CoA isomerase
MRQLRAFVGATVCLMAAHLTPAHAQSPAANMAKAATAFLATLDEGQAKLAKLPFDSEERFNWFFVPRARVGLPLKQMTAAQRDAARALLEAGLSEKGYSKAEAVRMLEPVLAAIESNPVRRDLELYYVTVFGDPSASGTWGWRYEGHHLSLHWTIVAGRSVATTPQFMGSNPAEVRDNYKNGVHMIVKALYNLEIPLIAAVNGAAIGLGCDGACMADIRISSDNARYGVTFLKIGLIPGDGGAWLLPRVIGMSRACELLFTGNVIDARTALEWGLVSKVVPGDQLMGEAMQLAESIAKQPPQALRIAKQLLRNGTQANYDTIMEMSAAAQGLMHHTKDHEEGVAAILEKREPVFKGE